MKDILKDSKISLENKELTIELKLPSASFLKLKKIDEYIVDLAKKFYGEEIYVNIYDSLNAKEDFAKNQVDIKIEKTVVTANISSKPPIIPKEQDAQTPSKPKIAEGVIYGRGISNTKVDKIEDINQDMENACIEGKI